MDLTVFGGLQLFNDFIMGSSIVLNDEREERLCLTSSLGESESGIVRLFSPAHRWQLYVSHRASAFWHDLIYV